MGPFGFSRSRADFNASFVSSNESSDRLRTATDDWHFRDVELYAGQLEQLIDRRAGGEQSGKSVRFDFAVDVIRADNLAGTGHVFDDDRRVAGDMARQMTHHQASDNVAPAARG